MMKVQVPLASSIVDIGLVLLSKQCLTKKLKKSLKVCLLTMASLSLIGRKIKFHQYLWFL